MPIVYSKLFDLLKEKGYTTYRIRKEKLIGQATLTALKNGTGGLDAKTIARLCEVLDCQPGDMMEYVKENDGYVLLAVKESMWASMLEEVLKDNDIPCVSVPVFGAGFTLKTGMQECLKVFVPSKSKMQAEELMNELFSAEEDGETGENA